MYRRSVERHDRAWSKMEVMTTPVRQSWERITNWLRTNASATSHYISPPASDIDTAATGFAIALPDDLKTWWNLTNGTSSAELIPPFFAALSIQDSQVARARLLNNDAQDELGAAGDSSGTFLQEFIPIAADGSGDFLFVDLRPGEATGCVRRWSGDEGSLTPTYWPSLRDLLADIANSLETGQPALQWHAVEAEARYFTVATYQPEVRAGTLAWAAV